MDVSSMAGVPSIANTPQGSQAANGAGVAVLKRSLDIQAQSASTLIQAATPATQGLSETTKPVLSTQGLPEHIGRNINVTA